MDTRKYSADEWKNMADDVKAFRIKLLDLLEHTQTSGPFGPIGSWEIPTNQPEFERLRPEVSRLAGAAQVGFAVTNTLVRTRDEAGTPVTLNPAAAWLTITQPKAMLGREDVVEAASMAEGRLRSLAASRLKEEKSLAGRIAAVVRFPSRVRELTGYSETSAAGKATQWTVGVVLWTVVLGITGSLIATMIVSLF